MLKKLILAVLILLTALWLMGYSTQDVQNIPQLYSAYSSFRSLSSVTAESSSPQAIQTIATSFNRAIINSNSSYAYMIFKNNTYFVIRSETTYIINGRMALEIYESGTETVTTVTAFPTDFSRMNIVDLLVTYYHSTHSSGSLVCPGQLFFLTQCPTSVTYTVEGETTFFYIDNSVTITLLPSTSS